MGAESINPKGHGSNHFNHGNRTEVASNRSPAFWSALPFRLDCRGGTRGTRHLLFRDCNIDSTSEFHARDRRSGNRSSGCILCIVTNVLIGINLATASTAHLTNIQAARFLTTSINSGVGQSFLDVYAFSEYLAPILMLVALWRSRMVPRWLAVVFFFGIALAEQTASVGPVRVVALMALFAVAMVLLAVRIWKSTDSNDGEK